MAAFKLNIADLQFVLRQIKIAEANSTAHTAGAVDLPQVYVDALGNTADAAGALYSPASHPNVALSLAIPDPHVPAGLRAVDGSFNNLVEGRETWGASGNPMPRLFDPNYINDADDDMMPFGGPGAPVVTNTNYGVLNGVPTNPTAPGGNGGNTGNVADADPRTISNLIVDMSMNNPAAILAALTFAGSEDPMADLAAIMALNLSPAEAAAALDTATTALGTADSSLDAAVRAYVANSDPSLTAGLIDEIQQAAEGVTAAEAALAQAESVAANPQAAMIALAEAKGLTFNNGSLDIPNIAPDEGLSAPFNAWMTFFGQFFDHGLDLISKGGNGTIYIPLAADDPLVTHGPDGIAGNGDETGPSNSFMVLTRSTTVIGPNGEPTQRNVTTPFVDQNQTYTSHASHQVFLREYRLNGDGEPVATGKLLGGAEGGLATWADVKAQAREMLGIELTDRDVSAVPLLRTDAYGEFIRHPDTGFAQVIVGLGADGNPNTADDIVVSGTPQAPVDLFAAGAIRTSNAFLDDIAHNAVPVVVGGVLVADVDQDTGNAVASNPQNGRNLEYDDELLDRHFITGDGRGNENIGLSAVHHIFHSEHNRQVDQQRLTILQSGDVDFINEWLTTDISALPDGFADLPALAQLAAASAMDWDGERLFQAARMATEMQYQHLVFEEFGRKIQPNIDVFVFNNITDVDPRIFGEFANVIYRFGHSMLTENMPRIAANGQVMDGGDLTLIESFLNPVLFDNDGAISHDEGAAAIVRGMTIERGNEIDEFITGALRNNLLGLPLDLAAINIARGRDTGMPTLNQARQQLYDASGSSFLTPYTSWAEFAANLKNPISVVNFIAAYGTHETITGSLDQKRAAAWELVFGVKEDGSPSDIADRLDFLNATGAYAPDGNGSNDDSRGGLNDIDLWIGGLAEKKMPFGGMLGSTFNAVFELQMENLQDGDRFYYLTRTQGQNFLNSLEQNSFAKMIMANTALAQPGADGIRGTADDVIERHIGVDSFATYDYVLEVDASKQADYNGAAAGVDPLGNDPTLEALGLSKVLRDDPGTAGVDSNYIRFFGGEHVVLGGTAGNDTIIGDFGDDGIWGDAGDDRIEAGAGVDLVNGGAGNDIITDSGDTGDFLKGDEGDDVIANSNGLDILMGGSGKDVFFVGVDSTEVFAGEGDDFILGGDGADFLLGNEGDDWMEAGGGFDTTAGDNSELFFNSAIKGHDVMFAGNDEHDFDAESGDDIMVQGESVIRNEGMFGFDWAIFKGMSLNAYADMNIPIFTTEQADVLRNRFDKVEALSGWDNNDTLIGDSRLFGDIAPGATVGTTEGVFFNDGLDQAGLDRIDGLDQIVQVGPSGFFESGNILLGGAGSDIIEGNGGDDILDGDRWLNVRIRITEAGEANAAENQIATVDSLKHVFTAQENPAWAGKSLFELMITRTITPGQLHIVREIIEDDGVNAQGVHDTDVAVFNDVRANYNIIRGHDDTLTVTHTTLTDQAVDDGTDTLRNMEQLRFADGTVSVALVLDQPFDRLNIRPTANSDAGTLEAAFTTGANTDTTLPERVTSLQWEVLDANRLWRPVAASEGTLAPNNGRFTPAAVLTGAELRVVATWTTSASLPPSTQTTSSVETGIVGTAADEDLTGSTAPNVILGLAGDDDLEGEIGNDLIDGGDGDDRIDGGEGDDILRGNDGADILIGRVGNNRLEGGAGDDELSGGHGNDSLDGGAGTDTAVVSGPVEAYSFVRAAGVITVSDNLGVEGDGIDTLTNIELLQVGEVDVFALGNSGTAAADIVVGDGLANTIAGGAGNDLIFAGGSNDTINWTATSIGAVETANDGRDFVDGGAGTLDRFVVNGSGAAETFVVYAAAAALSAGFGNLKPGTEIVITRNGAVIAELDNVEEITINTGAGNDTVTAVGNFNPTSLNFNTITINGDGGNDTVDVSALQSAHRILFRSNGGSDTILGDLRPQDVIELAPGTDLAGYALADNGNGTQTLSNGTHSITFTGAVPPQFQNTPPPAGNGEGVSGAFEYTPSDLAGLKALVNGLVPATAEDDAVPTGPRALSGLGNNQANPAWGSADQPFIRITDAHYGAPDADGNRAINPIFDGLDPRQISNILGAQEAGLPKAGNDANIFFMTMGQYIDHGLDFLPKGGNGTIAIGGVGGGGPFSTNPADLTRAKVIGFDADGNPLHKNQTSPYVDQNQAYGSHNLVGQFLRESDGNHGAGMRLLAGAPDPSNPEFNLLPTLRELIRHHWSADTIFTDPSLPGGQIGFRAYYTNYAIDAGTTGTLFDDEAGAFDPGVVSKLISNFMGSGHPLLLDANPFVNVLDHFVAGDGRANENFGLTAIHTIWARNHNYHVDGLLAAGFAGTAEEVFQAAKMVNEAEYQRVVFDEYLDTLLGGLRSVGTHGFEEYDPNANAAVSHEFAAAAFRFGHSLIGQKLTVLDADGDPVEVNLYDAFLNPSNAAGVFSGPLPPGYVPQPGYAQYGVNAIIGGQVVQASEDVDFNIVDAVRNDLVRISADLFAFNVARGWDVGLGTLNQVRMDLAASTDPYVREAVGFAGGDLSAYTSWADFQTRNGLSNAVIAQFMQAYPDLVLAAADIAAFQAINPDIAIAMQQDGTGIVKGIDRVDFWVGGLAEKHINDGIVGQSFWVVLSEQFERLQDADRFYYIDRFDGFDFYQNFIDGQGFADIVARNTGMTNLPEHMFQTDDEDAAAGGDDPSTDDGDTVDDGDGVGAGGDGEDGGDGSTDGDDGDDGDDPVDDGEDGGVDPVDDDDVDGVGDDDGQGDNDDDGTDDGDDAGPTPVPVPPVVAGLVVAGTAAADVMVGGAAADVLSGGEGDDILLGGEAGDTLMGGSGSDLVKGDGGSDVIFGGSGGDVLFGGGGADLVLGDEGDDRLFGDEGDDVLEGGAGSDVVYGGSGDDRFIARQGDGDDIHWGESGADTLDYAAITAHLSIDLGNGSLQHGSVVSSQSGFDAIFGFENVIGGAGDDTIVASTAVNVIDGGGGNDSFVFRSAADADGDVIRGFAHGDRIDLSGMAGPAGFTLATASLTGAGQVLVTHVSGGDGEALTRIQGNVSGGDGADFTLDVAGHHNLTQSDFNGVS